MKKDKNIPADEILDEFDKFTRAKKVNSINTKLCLLFAVIVIVFVLMWALSISQTALNKVVVIERSGEYVKTSTTNSEDLFFALIKNTCKQAVEYTNSFDRLTLQENQARAKFYVNTDDLNAVFQKYNNDRVYNDVLQNGAVYKCFIEQINTVNNENEPYYVQFTSILMLYAPGGQTFQFRIITEGELIRTQAQFPENVTGFFFTKYIQSIQPINNTE
jgi:hypothetical protein